MTALTGQLRASQVGWLLLVGCLSGFFSGLFGVGGGLIIVPGLVVVLGMEQRRAVGTSLLAIVPAIAVGVAAYAYGGSVDVVAGGLLAVGAVVGAQLGTRVLMRLRRRTAQWIFVGFVSVMIVQLMLVVPDRGAELLLDPGLSAALVLVGLVAGMLSAILGIGGGGVVVPVLMLWFGASDLVAKGASLVMMIPGVLSGVWANLRRRNVDVRAALSVGAASLVTSPFGAWVAHQIPPQVASILFAAFLTFVGGTMIREAIRPEPPLG
ncbi:MAG: sulfite exporter TauE/SafE family protein [Propionibacteriaceae bacterium]|nr:sulfite exporter TauE/SafE family protein [Propionibacteriaceae bacterium]